MADSRVIMGSFDGMNQSRVSIRIDRKSPPWPSSDPLYCRRALNYVGLWHSGIACRVRVDAARCCCTQRRGLGSMAQVTTTRSLQRSQRIRKELSKIGFICR